MNPRFRIRSVAACAALTLLVPTPAEAQLTGQLGILDLTANGGIAHPINTDELGNTNVSAVVFAGTVPSGTKVDNRYLGTTTPSKAGNTIVVVETGISGPSSNQGHWI